MQKLVPDHLVSQILKLNLPMRLIADRKAAFPMVISEELGKHTYKVLLDMGENSLLQYNDFFLELKGKIDIEYVKYGGTVTLKPIPDEPDYYEMRILRLYNVNKRQHRRVPYRRMINIIAPIESQAILVNLSATGAMIRCASEIEGSTLSMSFTLLQKNIMLSADIIEQSHNDESGGFNIRCKFNAIDAVTQKVITDTVKKITLKAKERLQEA